MGVQLGLFSDRRRHGLAFKTWCPTRRSIRSLKKLPRARNFSPSQRVLLSALHRIRTLQSPPLGVGVGGRMFIFRADCRLRAHSFAAMLLCIGGWSLSTFAVAATLPPGFTETRIV